MEMHSEVVRHHDSDVLVVSFSGTIPPGSEGNADAAAGRDYIKVHLTQDHAALILDLTRLDYVFGDSVGSWFLHHPLPTRLVVSGATGKALRSLISASGLEEVVGEDALCSSLSLALASLPGN